MGDFFTAVFSSMGITGILVYFFRDTLTAYLTGYLQEKGKGLATKEDIGKITDEIEKVKIEYAKQLESVKTGLSAKLKMHGFRYEKEFLLMEELTELLSNLRQTTINLCWKATQFQNGTLYNEGKVEYLGKNGMGQDVFYIPTHTISIEKNREQDDYPNEFYYVDSAMPREQRISEYHDALQKLNAFLERKKVFLGLDLHMYIQQINEQNFQAIYLIQRNDDELQSFELMSLARHFMSGVESCIYILLNHIHQRTVEWESIKT